MLWEVQKWKVETSFFLLWKLLDWKKTICGPFSFQLLKISITSTSTWFCVLSRQFFVTEQLISTGLIGRGIPDYFFWGGGDPSGQYIVLWRLILIAWSLTTCFARMENPNYKIGIKNVIIVTRRTQQQDLPVYLCKSNGCISFAQMHKLLDYS